MDSVYIYVCVCVCVFIFCGYHSEFYNKPVEELPGVCHVHYHHTITPTKEQHTTLHFEQKDIQNLFTLH